jgi:hypothetical protein
MSAIKGEKTELIVLWFMEQDEIIARINPTVL